MARDAVAEVRERTDIVDLVQSYVQLKRTGRSLKGLCPFHQERTPSFIVFPESQNFHCFGCGKGGDVFTFFMGVENVDFREALTELARRAGVELQTVPTIAPEVDAHRLRLIELNEMAAAFYSNALINTAAGAQGRAIVEQRQVSSEMTATFGLGFAPDSWDALLRFLEERGVDPVLASEAGLLQTRDSGGYYDRFRNRLMFPIRNREGRTVGFGARALGDAQPKYLNSPQSSIFDKSSLVYALDLAKDGIRSADKVVIVEGYMDVIAAHQFGYRNVVACMGTAVTEAQIALVKRLSKHIVLALDSDNAGQMATLRSLEMLPRALDSENVPVAIPVGERGYVPRAVIQWERRLNAEISIVRLPEGKDPDELIRRSPERWPEVVDSAQPFLDFLIDGVTATIDLTDAREKAEAVRRVAPILHDVGDRVIQAHYAGVLAKRLNLPESTVFNEVRRGAPRTSRPETPNPPPTRSTLIEASVQRRASQEDHVIALLLKHRDICGNVMDLVPADLLMDARNREILTVVRDRSLPLNMPPESLLAGMDDLVADHGERLLQTLRDTPGQYAIQIENDIKRAVVRMRESRYREQLIALQTDLRDAESIGDRGEITRIAAQLAALTGEHGQFAPPESPYFRDSRRFAAQKSEENQEA